MDRILSSQEVQVGGTRPIMNTVHGVSANATNYFLNNKND